MLTVADLLSKLVNRVVSWGQIGVLHPSLMGDRGLEIVPGIHRIKTPHQGRWLYQHLIVLDSGVVLIDTGTKTTPERYIIPYLRGLGLSTSHIHTVIVSHCDADHCGGNGEIARLNGGIRFISQSAEAKLLQSTDAIVQERYGEFGQYGVRMDDDARERIRRNLGDAVSMSETFAKELELEGTVHGRKVTIRLIHAPGHTKGQLIVHIPERSTLIITDAILGDSVPGQDGRPAMPPTYRYTDDYIDTIQRIRRTKVDYVLPSHFSVIQGTSDKEAFCDLSHDYVRQVEAFLLHEFSGSDVLKLQDIIDHANDQLGTWPRTANSELTYCLLGGLERLVGKGEIDTYEWGWRNSRSIEMR